MARKRRDEELFEKLRLAGVRKRVAGAVSDASDLIDPRRLASDLRSAADAVEERVRSAVPGGSAPAKRKSSSSRSSSSSSSSRSAAAKKAAATRAKKSTGTKSTTAKRKTAAKKPASGRTRAARAKKS